MVVFLFFHCASLIFGAIYIIRLSVSLDLFSVFVLFVFLIVDGFCFCLWRREGVGGWGVG